MICTTCTKAADDKGNFGLKWRKAKHKQCKGGTWCECQHRAK